MNNVKWLWGLMGGLLLLLCVVSWSWYRQEAAFQVVAVVGDQSISESDWISALKQRYGEQMLTEMVNHAVVEQAAERLGITVPPEQVEAELASRIPRFTGGQELSVSFQREMDMIHREALREEVRIHLLLQAIATREVTVSEEEMRTYYSTHTEEFFTPARAHVWQIVAASMEEARRIHSELEAGGDFAGLAKERSIDSGSADNGGDLGWLSLRDSAVPDPIMETIASLPLFHDSDPVPVEQGFAIFRVVARKDAVQLTFEEAREQIRQKLALAQVSLAEVLERLKKEAGVVRYKLETTD